MSKEREARGQKCLDAAREARFESNGEVKEAPDLNDAVKERAVTGSKGSKSVKK